MRGNRIQLATELIYKVIDDAVRIGFDGWLCLNFFNEPLLDPRLPEVGRYAMSKGIFREVFANTNGDLLDLVDVAALDGAVDRLHVGLYGRDITKHEDRIRSMFEKTEITFPTKPRTVTHYSPYVNFKATVEACRRSPCLQECRQRIIIAHTGEMRLCCEDIAGEWDLGNVRTMSLEELWFSPKHTEIVLALAEPGGRLAYPYCAECPRM